MNWRGRLERRGGGKESETDLSDPDRLLKGLVRLLKVAFEVRRVTGCIVPVQLRKETSVQEL